MADFTIAGVTYQSRPLDGETQLFVMKRLLPAITALVGCKPLLDGAQAQADRADAAEADGASADDASTEPASFHDLLMPVARELAAIKDADLTYVLKACMAVTMRPVGGGGVGWKPVLQNGVIQNQDDAKFATRLLIAWHVVTDTFSEVMGSFGIDVARLVALKLPGA